MAWNYFLLRYDGVVRFITGRGASQKPVDFIHYICIFQTSKTKGIRRFIVELCPVLCWLAGVGAFGFDFFFDRTPLLRKNLEYLIHDNYFAAKNNQWHFHLTNIHLLMWSPILTPESNGEKFLHFCTHNVASRMSHRVEVPYNLIDFSTPYEIERRSLRMLKFWVLYQRVYSGMYDAPWLSSNPLAGKRSRSSIHSSLVSFAQNPFDQWITAAVLTLVWIVCCSDYGSARRGSFGYRGEYRI